MPAWGWRRGSPSGPGAAGSEARSDVVEGVSRKVMPLGDMNGVKDRWRVTTAEVASSGVKVTSRAHGPSEVAGHGVLWGASQEGVASPLAGSAERGRVRQRVTRAGVASSRRGGFLKFTFGYLKPGTVLCGPHVIWSLGPHGVAPTRLRPSLWVEAVGPEASAAAG